MYFMPRTNRLCTFFAPLPSRYRYAITILFLGLIVSIWYCGMYCRIARSMATTSQAMTNCFAQNKNTIVTQSDSSLVASLEQAQRALRDYNSAWKTAGIELILMAITKAGLRFVSSDVTTKKSKAAGTGINTLNQDYVQDSITLHVVGTLKQCSQFFTLIAASGVDFACQQIDLVATDNNLYAMSCVLNVVTTDGTLFDVTIT